MFNLGSNTISQCKRVLVVIGLSAALAGCALDDLTREESFEPYGGSKQHPIKVVNGKAVVDKCGDWSEDLTDTFENTMSPNHGCAVQANIAAMAANPNDLVRARRMSPTPAFTRVAPIKGLAGGASGAAASESASTSKP